jgi:phospholipase/carboxylesterase
MAAQSPGQAPAVSQNRSQNAGADLMVSDSPDYIEYASGGAKLKDPLPMLILMHGKASTPEAMLRAFANVHAPARIIVPRGVPLDSVPVGPFNHDYGWWSIHTRMADEQSFALAAAEASRRLSIFIHRLLREKPTLGKPVIVGFSQGAIITYTISVQDPDLMSVALPLSGMLPLPLVPEAWPAGRQKPVIHAFHGVRDPIVLIEQDRVSVARLKALGIPATIREYPNLVHALGPLEMIDVLQEVNEALRHEEALSRNPGK